MFMAGPRARHLGDRSAGMVHCGPFVGESFSFFQHMAGMPEPTASLTPLDQSESRHSDRTHMFVAALLIAPTGSGPVQIRNMSRGGALIEGAMLPDRDASVTLRRGSLEMAATIMWKSGRKAGLAFKGAVEVAAWMTRNQPSHQALVDEIVRGVRKGSVPPAPASGIVEPSRHAVSPEAELSALKDELTRLEKGLTNDPVLVAAHPEIQLLDIALQRVGRLLGDLPPQ